MSIELRALLIISSVFMIAAVVLKIRKSKFQIHDGVFWFSLSLLFLVLSIFPEIAIRLASFIGIESAANLVFLCILALLLLKNFLLSLKISFLEYKIAELAQRFAIERADVQDKESK
ncbi:MAG: DUF2304 domain-containing protein [Oscillospiraceae bacterium]|nr:DUF2304 domain-containing protein [Oscillospiraceae bacterium]